MCDRLGLPHPDYLWELLTWDQWQDVKERWYTCPWGEHRADLRQEALIVLLLSAFSGESSDGWQSIFPYQKPTQGMSYEHLKKIEG